MLQKYTKYPKNAIYGLVAQNLTAAEVTNIAKKATIVLHPGQTLRFLMNGFFWDYGNNSGSLKVSRSGVSLVFVDPIKAVTLKPKLQPADLPRNSHFGYSVAISSNWAIVGAHAAGALCQANAGAAYLFQCEGGVSQPKPKLQPADLPRNSHFG
ncbi:FG-GAP repeat protein, partial [Kamptonema formosum]|uniref:FG-GAP repeat protein n=1 Tax=Kamptonema formosum TaxID=331992 RepID=UPI0005C43CDC